MFSEDSGRFFGGSSQHSPASLGVLSMRWCKAQMRLRLNSALAFPPVIFTCRSCSWNTTAELLTTAALSSSVQLSANLYVNWNGNRSQKGLPMRILPPHDAPSQCKYTERLEIALYLTDGTINENNHNEQLNSEPWTITLAAWLPGKAAMSHASLSFIV